ncbi:MAG TPA: sigma-70 family RNA polymerase sigma factor [Herpetosiphonaceae bacterium]|nr:sigma-70 family RNA polymerase sigma factor [Herpetosiphonaceae bacterium]
MIYRTTPQAQGGESAGSGLEQLFARYNPLVVRTAYLLLGDWMEAEDVAQEVWIQVGRHQGRYDPQRGAWTTWLHKITVNRCLNTRRRLRRWISGALAADLPADLPPPLQALIKDEEQRRIWRAVEGLSRKLRPVVVLRYFHNLSYEQIAEVLECPIGTVRSRLHAANAQLRATLGDL